ncbi:hypothetical protein G4B88_013671 [Cannabis sativa]|uniref:Uncharacterized protein n=1 Tax=Cannabis sativa TaxID=3483 RepID=A0A7J6HTL2_CANSA|nr:hypothetical protein G4B88_013671 [Cannabis sativa]
MQYLSRPLDSPTNQAEDMFDPHSRSLRNLAKQPRPNPQLCLYMHNTNSFPETRKALTVSTGLNGVGALPISDDATNSQSHSQNRILTLDKMTTKKGKHSQKIRTMEQDGKTIKLQIIKQQLAKNVSGQSPAVTTLGLMALLPRELQ